MVDDTVAHGWIRTTGLRPSQERFNRPLETRESNPRPTQYECVQKVVEKTTVIYKMVIISDTYICTGYHQDALLSMRSALTEHLRGLSRGESGHRQTVAGGDQSPR